MTPDVLRRFMLAKMFYLRGDLRHRTSSFDIARLEACMLLHNAVEIAMKTLASVRGAPPKKREPLAEIIERLDDITAAVRYSAEFRDYRNVAVHAGIPPDQIVLVDMSTCVRDVLRETCHSCGTEYDDVSLLPLVGNPDLDSLLTQARTSFETSPDKSTSASRLALAWLRHMLRYVLAESKGIPTWDDFDLEGRRIRRSTTDSGEAKHTAQLLDAVVSASGGFELSEEIKAARVPKENATAEQARWLLEYVATHTVRLEDELPHLKKLAPSDTRATSEQASTLDGKWIPIE